MDLETFENNSAHKNTFLRTLEVPYLVTWKRFWPWKWPYPTIGMAWQFPWLDMAIFRPKTFSHWPNMALPVPPKRYFDWQVCFYRFLGLLDRNNWEKVRKKSKSDFSGCISCFQGQFKVLEFDPWARFWCSLGPWWGIGICKVVSQCLFVFSRQLEGSKMTSTKKWHFCPDIHKVNEALYGGAGCHP